MMETEFFVIISVVLLILLFLVNEPVKTRYRQGSIVGLSFIIYGISLFVYLSYKEIIYFEWIEQFRHARIFELLQEQSDRFMSLLQREVGVGIGNYIVLISAFLIVVLHILFKFILLASGFLYGFFIKDTEIPFLAASWFERVDNTIIIKSKYVFFGKVSRAFGAFLFLSVLPVLIFMDTPIIWPAYLPVSALIFLEIGFFLDSTQRDKQTFQIFVEEPTSAIVSKLDELFEKYKETFAEKLLAENRSQPIPMGEQQSYQVKEVYLQFIYENLKSNGIEVSDDYFKGLDNLISSSYQNVLFSNSFDTDYGLYLNILFDYAYFYNQRVMVVVMDIEEKEKTLQWIEKLIESEVYNAFDDANFDYSLRSSHILVDTIGNILKDHNHFDKFFYTIILDMKNFIRENHFYLNAFLNIYKTHVGYYPKMVGFSNLSNALEPSFNNIFILDSDKTSEVKVRQNKIKNFYTIVFRSEGQKKYQEFISINNGSFIGKEVPLAFFAWKMGIRPIVIFSDESSIEEEIEDLERSHDEAKFFSNDILALSQRFLQPLSKKNKLFVVNDDGNLHQTIVKWKNYAVSHEMMLIVVSSFYLLRDYLAKNFETALKEMDWFKEIFPKGRPSEREMSYLLLSKLSTLPVNKEDIKLLEDTVVSRRNIAKYLNKFLEEKISFLDIFVKREVKFETDRFVSDIYYEISKKKYSPNLLYYSFINENGGVLGNCLEDDVYHKYLEGMKIVRNGKAYKILQIDVPARSIRLEFRPTIRISQYDIRKYFTVTGVRHMGTKPLKDRQIGDVSYRAEFVEFDYECRIEEYSERCNLKETYKIEEKILKYKEKETLSIRYIHNGNIFNDKMRLAFEFMLNGVFQTIFPDMHHLLSARVLTQESRDSFKTEYSVDMGTNSKELTVYIFETARLNHHLLTTIITETYYHRILMLIQDFILWGINTNTPILPLTKYDVIENMDFQSLSEFIDILLQQKNEITDSRLGNAITETYSQISHICDFCGDSLPIGQFERLSDGRERCERCKGTSVEYLGHKWETLLDDAFKYVEDRYGIKIDRGLDVRIVNSDTLMEQLDRPFQPTPGLDARAVGLAVDTGEERKTIYIENAAPKFRAMATIVHELTHIWQFHNLDFGKMDNDDVKIEGHAQWVELTYVEEIYPNERRFIEAEKARTDEYGRGYRYVEQVLRNRETSNKIESLFSSKNKGNPFDAYRDMFGK